ncbi:MAG: hypothetical protein QNJ16_04280 [Rhodobacter sp.]|nr:hypothetical protein [Rhodobacter sp.]
MSDHDRLNRILTFAQHLGRGWEAGAEHEARSRRWLDDHGRPTADGLALLAALEDQRATRTVFRTVA